MTKAIINADVKKANVNRNIYGHFIEHLGACVYGGIWVGEDSSIPNTNGIRNDVIAALKQLNAPVLRYPGGCFADEYHWMDGVGPRENRPKMLNTHWGNVVENNHFGTHEYMQLCELIGAEPYICGNVGSGTVREMQQWIEYMTLPGVTPMAELRRKNGREQPWKLKYFGVGNENWGCGGNMTPDYYAGEYRRYATYCRNHGDNKLFKIACGPNSGDYEWTDVLMRQAGKYMDGLALHYYTMVNPPAELSRSATQFGVREWFHTIKNTYKMEELIANHSAIMDRYDPNKRVALIVDEWGTWYAAEPGTNPAFNYQQNTMRDAVVAAINLNIFNKYAARVRMANIAQTINVLQSVILTDGEKMLKTPTYHIFDMYKAHMDAQLVETLLPLEEYSMDGQSMPAISMSATVNDKNQLNVSIVNAHHEKDREFEIYIHGINVNQISGQIVRGDSINAHNTFENPNNVVVANYREFKRDGDVLQVNIPAASVVTINIK